MSEELGCELDKVWLTVALVGMPIFLTPVIPEPYRFITWICVVGIIVVLLSPYSVFVADEGITVKSILTSVDMSWEEIELVVYNESTRVILIKGSRRVTIIPFAIWVLTRAAYDYYALLDVLEKQLGPEKLQAKGLL